MRSKALFGEWRFLLAFLLPLAAYGPSLVMQWVWFDLRSVQIERSANGAMMVEAARIIRRDFWGTYDTVIRRAANDTVICHGGALSAFEYSSAANATNPLRMSLRQWVGQTEPPCMDDTGPTFTYPFYVTTCHSVVGPWNIRIATRCVDSEVFEG